MDCPDGGVEESGVWLRETGSSELQQEFALGLKLNSCAAGSTTRSQLRRNFFGIIGESIDGICE